MVHGSPKFVRCFKPNNDRIPGCFDTQTVLEQLKYSGILAGLYGESYFDELLVFFVFWYVTSVDGREWELLSQQK
jgi:hypothetical protein